MVWCGLVVVVCVLVCLCFLCLCCVCLQLCLETAKSLEKPQLDYQSRQQTEAWNTITMADTLIYVS